MSTQDKAEFFIRMVFSGRTIQYIPTSGVWGNLVSFIYAQEMCSSQGSTPIGLLFVP